MAERNRNRTRIEESPERSRRERVDLADKRVCFRQISRAVMEMMLVQFLKEVAEQVGVPADESKGFSGLMQRGRVDLAGERVYFKVFLRL